MPLVGPFDIAPVLTPPPPGSGPLGKEEFARWASDENRALASLFQRISQNAVSPSGDAAAPSGGYAVTPAAGTGNKILRATAVFPFPEALGTLADRSKKLTLTSPGVGVAVLTPSGLGTSGGTDYIQLFAPNAVGGAGFTLNHLGLAGFGSTIAQTNAVWSINKLDFDRSDLAVVGIQSNLVQAGSGDASLGSYVSLDITGQASSASGANANPARIGCLGLHAGAVNNANYSGATTGLILAIRVSRNAAGATGDLTGIDVFGSFQGASWTSNSLRMNNTNTIGVLVRGPLNTLGTTVNMIGFQSNAFTQGTNRKGFVASGMTTGAPAVSYGFESLHHTVGVLQRSFVGDESLESRLQHVIVSTAGKGFIVRDTADGNYYMLNTTLGILNAPVNMGPGPIPA